MVKGGKGGGGGGVEITNRDLFFNHGYRFVVFKVTNYEHHFGLVTNQFEAISDHVSSPNES